MAFKSLLNAVLKVGCTSTFDPTTCYLVEGNVLFNDALNTFYLRLYDVRYMVKEHSDRREETCCRLIGYSFRLAVRVLLYASSQDNTYHSLCYTSRGALAGTRNMLFGRLQPVMFADIQLVSSPLSSWCLDMPARCLLAAFTISSLRRACTLRIPFNHFSRDECTFECMVIARSFSILSTRVMIYIKEIHFYFILLFM